MTLTPNCNGYAIGAMKTMLTILTMLLAGSVFAEYMPKVSLADAPVCHPTFDIRKCDTTPGAVIPPSSASSLINKPADPNVQWAASPSKVDYSIVTLPDGQTASVLTFKD
jgi:hypothetical protein